MYQAMPARCGPPSGLSAVSRAPHSLPLAHVTCCIRVSFESIVGTTSGPPPAWAAAEPRSFQHPVPAMEAVVSSFRQCPCGAFVPGGVPDPGCFASGGTPYWPTVRILLLRLTAGDAEFSEAVFLSVQTISWFDVRVPPVPL